MSTSTARVRAYRERRRQSGTVFLSVELSPTAAAILAAVREQTGDSAQDAINGIILAYAGHDNPTNGKNAINTHCNRALMTAVRDNP